LLAAIKQDVDAPRHKLVHARLPTHYARASRNVREERAAMAMTWRAALVSLLLFSTFIGAWHLATRGSGPVVSMDPEYAKLVGATASQGKSAMPGPADVGLKIWQHLKDPFYDRGSNDKGSASSSPIRSRG
jgi:hypothetical protein